MTWSKSARTSVGVTVYSATDWQDNNREIVRIQIGQSYADLTPEDAASLGGYLLSKAPDHNNPN